jgi:phage tail-like protein
MTVDSPYQIYQANHFRLEIEGIGTAQFVEVSGLAVKVATIPYRAGGEGQVVHQLPGQVDLAPVVCRYGLTPDNSVFAWMKASMRGEVVRRNVSVVHLASDGSTELSRYNLYDAWPCEWRASELHSLENHVAIESLAIVYESIDRV